MGESNTDRLIVFCHGITVSNRARAEENTSPILYQNRNVINLSLERSVRHPEVDL